jgi:hypothetical protein
MSNICQCTQKDQIFRKKLQYFACFSYFLSNKYNLGQIFYQKIQVMLINTVLSQSKNAKKK